MGRWVTSKGRRIYIPDEGEKVPEKYKKNVVGGMTDDKKSSHSYTVKVNQGIKGWKEDKTFDNAKDADEYVNKLVKEKGYSNTDFNIVQKKNDSSVKDTINKNESLKEKQIAANKKEAKQASNVQSTDIYGEKRIVRREDLERALKETQAKAKAAKNENEWRQYNDEAKAIKKSLEGEVDPLVAKNYGKKEADKAKAKESVSGWDKSSVKKYKTKGAIAAKKSAEEMAGVGKNGFSLHEVGNSARDTTYELRDKEGNVAGRIVESRTARQAKLELYNKKRKK